MKRAILILFLISVFSLSTAFAVLSPKEEVKIAVDKVINIVKDPKYKGESKTPQRRAALRAEIGKIIDFEEMSKRSLGVYWKERTPAEKKEFIALYKDLLERSYANKIEAYTNEKVIYTDENIDGKYAEVRTKVITTDQKEIPIDYRLYFNGKEWKVYDIVIEGVSLVSNYRSQFNKIIRNYSYQELVKRMKSKQIEEVTREK